MVATVPVAILVVIAVAAAAILALVTWGILKLILRGPAGRQCPECGTGIPEHGACPRCARKVA